MSSEVKEPLLVRMAQVVGHEIRNPLAVINNSVYFVKTKLAALGAVDPKVARHLDIIAAEVNRADKLIEDLSLALRKPLEPTFSSVSVVDAVEAALEAAALPAGVKVKKSLPRKDVRKTLDGKLFQMALQRLIQNALEAMGEKGELSVTLTESGLELKDSGPGFSADVLGQLFQPFITTKPKNLGLGLVIAKKAFEAQKCRLSAKNGPGAILRVEFVAPSL